MQGFYYFFFRDCESKSVDFFRYEKIVTKDSFSTLARQAM